MSDWLYVWMFWMFILIPLDPLHNILYCCITPSLFSRLVTAASPYEAATANSWLTADCPRPVCLCEPRCKYQLRRQHRLLTLASDWSMKDHVTCVLDSDWFIFLMDRSLEQGAIVPLTIKCLPFAFCFCPSFNKLGLQSSHWPLFCYFESYFPIAMFLLLELLWDDFVMFETQSRCQIWDYYGESTADGCGVIMQYLSRIVNK